MHGEISRDLLACINDDGDLDQALFLSIRPMSRSLADALFELERLGYVSIDHNSMSPFGIADFDVNLSFIERFKADH